MVIFMLIFAKLKLKIILLQLLDLSCKLSVYLMKKAFSLEIKEDYLISHQEKSILKIFYFMIKIQKGSFKEKMEKFITKILKKEDLSMNL